MTPEQPMADYTCPSTTKALGKPMVVSLVLHLLIIGLTSIGFIANGFKKPEPPATEEQADEKAGEDGHVAATAGEAQAGSAVATAAEAMAYLEAWAKA